MAEVFPGEAIRLARWPSCDNCLASSEDNLAVACGENVHILGLKSDGHSSKQLWDVITIRVNQFLESEWPFQQLASTRLFSIGEEQSESLVVALAWSPSGLGLHKRAVLAVLTSNLVLSLWETDGTLSKYRRTCIINHSLPEDPANSAPEKNARRTCRIRAFCWHPVLRCDQSQLSGLYHLTIADDNANLRVLRISKPPEASFGQFIIRTIANYSIHETALPNMLLQPASPLQQKLYRRSTVSKITVSDWQDESSSKSINRRVTSLLHVEKGSIPYRIVLAVSSSNASDLIVTCNNETKDHNASLSLQPDCEPQLAANGTKDRAAAQAESLGVDRDALFERALKLSTKAFNAEFQLFGHYHVRWWGICPVLQTDSMAACITLHPSDMVEHTQPSTEKCLIIFTGSSIRHKMPGMPKLSEPAVHEQIIRFAISKLRDLPSAISDLDIRAMNILIYLSRQPEAIPVDVSTLETALKLHATGKNVGNTVSNDSIQHRQASETCQICSAVVPFSGDTKSARCVSGHVFTRCNLTFLSIQQPGISKYCSGCHKQYLDQAKLQLRDGPSLVQAIFAEFGVCPYCHAKFRG